MAERRRPPAPKRDRTPYTVLSPDFVPMSDAEYEEALAALGELLDASSAATQASRGGC